ncbi:MAG: PepSY-like domain-containing protein [Saprospiraceae bacterium]|nr:PepSY-like domain-containing protein [Saprospiraceae bacterium]
MMNAIANSSDKQAVTVAQLPTDVREYVALSFTPVEIEAAWRVRGMGYEVELEDGQDLYFRENGRCMGAGRNGGVFRCMRGDTVEVTELPQAATDYITATYDATIDIVVYKAHGDRTGYAVELTESTILLFNGVGEFVHICGEFDGDGPGGHGGHHGGGPNGPNGPSGGCAAGDTIDAADLPLLASEYITTNYSSENITVVVVKPSGKFGVELESGTVLLFTADGIFIKVCDGQPNGGPHHHHCNLQITFDDLPTVAKEYITTNYAGETVERGCMKNNGNYIVRLSNDVVILFDPNGAVLFDSGN